MRTITVKGVGNVSAKADYITLSMCIKEIETDYSTAMKYAARRIQALQQAACRNGCAKEDLKTTSFHADTRYRSVKGRKGDYYQEFVGYECAYRLKLSFDFESRRLADMLSGIAESGAKPELNITFTVKDPAKINEELLAAAAENARTKAEILCRASGCTLGQLANIDYNWGELDVLSRTSYDAEVGMQPMMAMSRCAAPEIEPEDISVSDTAAFTWEIL